MSDPTGTRRPFAVLSWTLLMFGLVLLVLSLRQFPLEVTARFALLAAATLVAESFALAMPGYGVSLTYPLLIALAVSCGPSATMVVALLISVNLEEIRMRLPPSVHAFNVGQLLISNGLAAWLYVSLGGRVLFMDGPQSGIRLTDFPVILLPLAAMVAIGALGNFSLLALGYSLKHGAKLSDVLVELGWLPPVQVALAGVGVMLAQIMTANNLALVLFIFPLFVARQFYQRFIALRSAYTDTIRSLVSALEAKDPYTRGHSERVAEYSVLLAHAAALDERAVSEVETSALLHDLGKLSVGGHILRKNTPLSEQEWLAIKEHPQTGAAMVQKIPHLRRLAEVISKHHERLDGSGYPLGAMTDEIPTAARILAIADSYDAMTSDRPYRRGLTKDDAIQELLAHRESLYDSELVDIFVRTLDPDLVVVFPPTSLSSATQMTGQETA